MPYWIQFDAPFQEKMEKYLGVKSVESYLDNTLALFDMGSLADISCTDMPSVTEVTQSLRISQEKLFEVKKQSKVHIDKYSVADLGGFWTHAAALRGVENLTHDLVSNHLFVHELLDSILDVYLENIAVCQKELEIDCILINDSPASYVDLVLPQCAWQDFLRPRLQRLSDAVHGFDFHFALGTTEISDRIIGDIVMMGVDILKPLKSECIDILGVKREFGQYITLWGVYGTNGTLVFSTPEHVRTEIVELYEHLAKGGGFIFSTDVSIHNDVPVENAAALIEVAFEKESGRF